MSIPALSFPMLQTTTASRLHGLQASPFFLCRSLHAAAALSKNKCTPLPNRPKRDTLWNVHFHPSIDLLKSGLILNIMIYEEKKDSLTANN